jgi:hypothetical protein
MSNDLKRMIETHARTEGCTEQVAQRDLSHELQALAADMGLDLKAALAVTTGDLSDRVEAIQNEREWDDEMTLSFALRFLTTIGQGDQFEAFLRTRADEEDAELGGVDPGDIDGDHQSGLASAGWVPMRTMVEATGEISPGGKPLTGTRGRTLHVPPGLGDRLARPTASRRCPGRPVGHGVRRRSREPAR